MNLVKKKGTLSIRGHAVLYVLIGPLVSGASSQAADTPEEEVSSLKLIIVADYPTWQTSCSAPAMNCTVCPEGWLHAEDQCLFLSTDRDDFNSTNKCTEIGGHLAIVTTKEQHDALEQEGKRVGGMYTYYWIGLSDVDNEGDWKWVDSSKPKTPYV